MPTNPSQLGAFAALRALGFNADLGVAWTIDHHNGTSIVISGIDSDGEPDEVSTDHGACVTLMRDPNDFATVIESRTFDSFAAALATAIRWSRPDFVFNPLSEMIAALRADGVTVEVLS